MSLSTLRGYDSRTLQGLVKYKPSIPFVPLPSRMFREKNQEETDNKSKVEFKKFHCKIDPDDTEETGYEYKMEVLDNLKETPESYCKWMIKFDELCHMMRKTQTGDKIALMRALTTGKAHEAFQQAYIKHSRNLNETSSEAQLARCFLLCRNHLALKVFTEEGANSGRVQKNFMIREVEMRDKSPKVVASRLEEMN